MTLEGARCVQPSPLLRRAAVVLVAASVLGGLLVLLPQTIQTAQPLPGAVATSLLFAVVTTAVLCAWLAWHELSVRVVLIALACGGLGAIALTYVIEPPLLDLVSGIAAPFRDGWATALVDAPVEELCKALAVVVVVVLFRDVFSDAVGAMAVGAVVGVGFQTSENHFDALNVAMTTTHGPVLETAFTWVSRSVELGLWLHPADAAISAAGIAIWLAPPLATERRRAITALGLVCLAMALHIYWDAPFLRGPGSLFDALFGALPRAVAGIVAVALVYRAMKRRSPRDVAAETNVVATP